MRKIFKILYLASIFSPSSYAYAAFDKYAVLTPIPGLQGGTVDTSGANLAPYLGNLYNLGVAGAAGLAVIMVIWGGIEYITSVASEGKSGGKERITSAILGLLLALGSYIILNTINPDLLKLNFDLKPAGIGINVANTNPTGNTAPDAYVDDFSNTIGMPSYVGNNATPDGTPFGTNITAYSPQAGGSQLGMEGGYGSSRPGLDGQSVVRTLDDVISGRSNYVTLAGDPSQYGKTYVIPSISYVDSNGQTKTLNNVTGYVHDTGSAFTSAGSTHFDIAIGKDYTKNQINIQPFGGQVTQLVPAKINN
jgi:hypothetical protein